MAFLGVARAAGSRERLAPIAPSQFAAARQRTCGRRRQHLNPSSVSASPDHTMSLQLTISTDQDQLVVVALEPNDPVERLTAWLEAETAYPAGEQVLIHNGRQLPIAPGQTLASLGLQPNDMLMLIRRPAGGAPAAGRPAAAGAGAAAAVGGGGGRTAAPNTFNPDGTAANPEALMSMLAGNAGQMQNLPDEMQAAIRSGNVPVFQDWLRRLAGERRQAQEEEERFRRMAEEDPFNPEVQRKLMEAIEQANVMENFESALEHNPEAFSSVCMLYVNMEVNGHPLKAFIDSGAQMTIMSRSCAERCNMLRFMDRRWQGMAVGVGSAKILGRIHMAQLKCGEHFFPCSITVLDQDGMEFLFGLENLKRHQCCIDLKDNVLRFGTTNSALPFLPEHEIPKSEERHTSSPDEVPMAQAPPAAAPGGQAPAAAAPQQQQQPQSGAAAPAGELPAGWEEKVRRLQDLGFSRQDCLVALRSANGNEELAGSLLFARY